MVRKLPAWAIEMESPEKLKISDIKRLIFAEHLSWRCASDTKGSSTIHRKSVAQIVKSFKASFYLNSN